MNEAFYNIAGGRLATGPVGVYAGWIAHQVPLALRGNERRDRMYVEMKVKFLTFDSTSNGFVVLLMDLSNKTGLPIWIGPFEANAIATKLKKNRRPSTVDPRPDP